ncbi:MAG TPA: hypothetical protein VGS80_13705 [Ktedonobacterales bacterium]|nr:hypothetical protein [Ktedonobacterales bacterium]
MASDAVPEDTGPPAPSAETHLAGTPTTSTSTGPQRPLGQRVRMLLVVSAALQIVTVLLPWEHLAIVSEHAALDTGVATFITTVPLSEVIYAGRCPPDVTCPHLTLAAIFWDVFWRGALLFTGLLLVLAFCLARRAATRWSFAVLYGLWLLYTTVLALSFVTTVHAIDTGTFALSTHPAWWEQVFRVIVTQAGAGDTNPLSPAWGYWLSLGALVLCWLALGMTIATLLRSRSRSAARAKRAEPVRARKAPLAAILVTAGALLWTTSVAVLPMVVADCSRPLEPLSAGEVQRLCQADAVVYPLQVSVLSLTLDPLPALTTSLAERATPGNVLLGMVGYLRDFQLLVLAVVAMPLAVVAAWRARRAQGAPPAQGARVARGAAVGLAAWTALILVETGFLLHVLTEILVKPAQLVRPVFPEGIGPGAVLVPLGAVLIGAGVVCSWLPLRLRRGGLGAAPAAEVTE